MLLLLGCFPELPERPEDSSVVEADADTDADSDTDADTDSDADTDTEPVDADGDGFPASEDCDDEDAEVHPGAEDLPCEDRNCDGLPSGIGSAETCPAETCSAANSAGWPSGGTWLDNGGGPALRACYDDWLVVFSSQSVSGVADRAGTIAPTTLEPDGSMLAVWQAPVNLSHVRFACDAGQDGTLDFDVLGPADVFAKLAGSDGLVGGDPVALDSGFYNAQGGNDQASHPDFYVGTWSGSPSEYPVLAWGTYDDAPVTSGQMSTRDVCNLTDGTRYWDEVTEQSTSPSWFYVMVR